MKLDTLKSNFSSLSQSGLEERSKDSSAWTMGIK